MPAGDMIANTLMIGSGVFLPAGGGIVPVAERERPLTSPLGLHARHGDRRDDLRLASPFDRRDVELWPCSFTLAAGS
jgi:hypothetical protein